MTTRERLLAIRLLKKQEKHPEYAKQLGIQVTIIKKNLQETEKKHV